MFSNCCKTYYKVKLLRMKKVGRKENSRESKSFMIVVMIIVMMKTMKLQVKKMTLRLVLWFCNKHTNLQYIQFFGYSKYVMVYKLNTAFISLLILGCMYFVLILIINMIKDLIVPRKRLTKNTQKVNCCSRVMSINTLRDVLKGEDLEEIRRGCFGHLVDM